VLNAERLDAALVRDTLNLLVKYEGDAETVSAAAEKLLA